MCCSKITLLHSCIHYQCPSKTHATLHSAHVICTCFHLENRSKANLTTGTALLEAMGKSWDFAVHSVTHLCIRGISCFLCLIENNKLHRALMTMSFLTANIYRNYIVEPKDFCTFHVCSSEILQIYEVVPVKVCLQKMHHHFIPMRLRYYSS